MLILGDCLNELKNLTSNSVDCLVSDPPYGMSFMGKEWDKALPSIDVWKECYRVMKPGAFGFIMCIPRQDCLSRMMISLEDAGFNINFTSLYWTYASGFPKALNVGKKEPDLKGSYGGFQPKPAVEVIIVVMKPLSEKTYVDQALENGKGVVWFDDCRIPYTSKDEFDKVNEMAEGIKKYKPHNDSNCRIEQLTYDRNWNPTESGRFPANLLVSDDVLDDGINHKSDSGPSQIDPDYSMKEGFMSDQPIKSKAFYGDSGSYSRFFSLDAWAEKNLPFLIVSKASKREKNEGCEKLEEKERHIDHLYGQYAICGDCKKLLNHKIDHSKCNVKVEYIVSTKTIKNNHPTVKPIKLMSYLITLGSRPGDVILDPFAGSGTTGVASVLLGRDYICIERDPEYFEILKARILHYEKEKENKPLTI